MAHVFKWKAIYRIVKNQRSPEIEEKGKAYLEEYLALLGTLILVMMYIVDANQALVERLIKYLAARKLFTKAAEMLAETANRLIKTVPGFEEVFFASLRKSSTGSSSGGGAGGEMLDRPAVIVEGPH